MPRLFTGIEIPRPVADRLMLLRADVPGARWISPENYHITLRFLGDVSEAVAEEYVSRIAPLSFEPFSLRVTGVGHFGSRRPHILWAGISANETLAEIHKAHERMAVMVGLEPEPRAFRPHVTLARLKGTRAEQIAPFLENFNQFESDSFEITRAILYSARPSRGGGPYVIEDEFPFEDDEQ